MLKIPKLSENKPLSLEIIKGNLSVLCTWTAACVPNSHCLRGKALDSRALGLRSQPLPRLLLLKLILQVMLLFWLSPIVMLGNLHYRRCCISAYTETKSTSLNPPHSLFKHDSLVRSLLRSALSNKLTANPLSWKLPQLVSMSCSWAKEHHRGNERSSAARLNGTAIGEFHRICVFDENK